jgi:signal transduction histidine kinase
VANLLENALGHTDHGATVRVAVAARDGTAIVLVEDSGPGIPVVDRERVFGRFVRLDEARAPGGVGLGLPIARMVARLHGGELAVETSALGGSAFRLVLPREG